MKLVCDACGSKYSISDDRVAGKVFKIRCKKCSQVIVVRGAQPVEAAAPEPEHAPSGEWHVVLDGQQSGPFERDELMRRHAAGELDDESFVWRDGMEEWAALGTIAELRSESTRVEPPADVFAKAGTDAPAHELFATSAPAGNARFTASASDAHELAASAPAAASSRGASTSSAFAGSAMVAADDSKRLLAERNENSVLFTLGNLAKLASPAPSKAASPSSAGTEGSGLIDIRALASTFAAPSAKAATAVGSIEDLPVYAPATFGEPIVLVPTASRGPDRKLMYMLLAAIAVLAIVATVLVFVVMRGSDSTGQVAVHDGNGPATTGDDTSTNAGNGTAAGPGTTGKGTAANGTAGATGDPAGNGAGSAGATSNATAAATSTSGTRPTSTSSTRPTTSTSSTRPAARPTTSASTTSTRPTTSTATTSTRPTTSTATSTTRPATTSTTRPTAPDRLQCEFSNYADKGCEVFRPATSNTAVSNLPDNLDRAAIAAGLGTIRAQACGGRSSARGDVAVTIKVNADGGVSGVTIKSSPDPVLSSCVTAAAGKGKFAKTKRGASFGYVWRF